MRTRTEIIEELNEQALTKSLTDTRLSIEEVKIELLLDIREILEDIKNYGVRKIN